MPSLDPSPALAPVKALVIGDSGSGKTGALLSLLADRDLSQRLLVLDYDGSFATSWLANSIRRHPDAADMLSRLHYATLQDKVKAQAGAIVPVGQPKAYSTGMSLLTNWRIMDPADPSSVLEDLGPSDSWDASTTLVIDSFSFMAKAAYRWHELLNATKDPRQTFFGAQKLMDGVLQLLCSDAMKCNVVVNSHITYVELSNGITKGFPAAIGKAFSPDIPKYFNAMLECRSTGVGANVRRTIGTVPTGLIELKNPVSEDLPADLPLATGLATYFRTIRGL